MEGCAGAEPASRLPHMNNLRTAWQVICLLIVLGLVAISIDGAPLLSFGQ
jgi:hypothetical protein